MKNKEELEKKTGIKRFSVCLMNPPYLGESRNDYNFPLKFLNKVCEITDKIVSIQPIMYLSFLLIFEYFIKMIIY